MIEFAIDKLNELWIKQKMVDNKRGKTAYIKKCDAYKELAELLKKTMEEEIWKKKEN